MDGIGPNKQLDLDLGLNNQEDYFLCKNWVIEDCTTFEETCLNGLGDGVKASLRCQSTELHKTSDVVEATYFE